MEFFPFFRRPYYYSQNSYMHSPYSMHNNFSTNMQNGREKKQNTTLDRQTSEAFSKKSFAQSSYNNKYNLSDERNVDKQDAPIFEIFGIKLFFDDILIIALLFFLYEEGVRDNLLFISLILILLS